MKRPNELSEAVSLYKTPRGCIMACHKQIVRQVSQYITPARVGVNNVAGIVIARIR